MLINRASVTDPPNRLQPERVHSSIAEREHHTHTQRCTGGVESFLRRHRAEGPITNSMKCQ